MQGMVYEEEERWIKHYSSKHKILLVGEGDFSFSVCLARAFVSASNMIATSLDTREVMIAKYAKGAANLKELKKLGCSIMHELDVHTMSQHSSLKNMKFDRILYNFPHAGLHYPWEHYPDQIKLHRAVVRGFFRNVREMLSKNGEAHVTHKTAYPFSKWGIEELAEKCGLYLVEEVEFSRLDYPDYENKKGHGCKSDLSFPVGRCSTFKFALSSTQASRYDGDLNQKMSCRKVSEVEIQFRHLCLTSLIEEGSSHSSDEVSKVGIDEGSSHSSEGSSHSSDEVSEVGIDEGSSHSSEGSSHSWN